MSGYGNAARLLNRSTLRGIRAAVGQSVARFEPPEQPTPALVALLEEPYESVDAATTRLSELEAALRARGDRRAVFLTIYAKMTAAVQEWISAGRFEDPAWMRRYLLSFAEYYRAAFLAFERGNVTAVPDPWQIAFGAAIDDETLVVQDALLGVNAHINYDLALALAAVGLDPDRAQKHADHRRIDDILRRLVDAQQEALAELYAPGVSDIDAVLGQFDETLTLRSMTEGREQAWRVAVIQTDVPLTVINSYARWILRTTATGGAFLILSPALEPGLQQPLQAIETEELDLSAILDRLHERVNSVGV